MHHAEHGHAVVYQRDVDGELAIALDELLGAVQRIHQPVGLPAGALLERQALRLLGQHGYIRRQGLQAVNDGVMRGHIGRRQRRAVILLLDRKIAVVDLENLLARHTGNVHGRLQQAGKVSFRAHRMVLVSINQKAVIHAVVIGVNRFRPEQEEDLNVLHVDNSAVREAQIASLKQLRAERDQAAVESALHALKEAAANGTGNLLELAVNAARAKATVGEVSGALEDVFGRYEAPVQSVQGVYGPAVGAAAHAGEVRELVSAFEKAEGRRPRILVAKMGQDGHDRGQKVIASALADLGFDVDIGPLFRTPAETARHAVENDVHIVGVSSLAAGHLTLVPELRKELANLGRDDLMIVAGGVIPPADYQALYDAGAAAIFGPGTVIGTAAAKLVRDLADNLGLQLDSTSPATEA